MTALKHTQPEDEVPAAIKTGISPENFSLSSEELTTLYRHVGRSLPLNVSLQHGTRYVAAALQKGILGTLVDIGWRNREKQMFAERVAEIITSDSFIAQASGEIGRPNKDETEDEFVERGKAVFRRLLHAALGR